MNKMRIRPSRPLSLSFLSVLVVVVVACGCSRSLDRARLSSIADAQLAVRVKTVLVNDPDVGTALIDVQVTGGVVRLSGQLASDGLRQRALNLARSVAGERGVESALTVGADLSTPASQDTADRPAPDLESPTGDDDGDRRLLAIGASVRRTAPAGSGLDSSIRISPLVRLGFGSGLGVIVGFGWFDADLHSANSERLGKLKVKPMMAGLGYTIRETPASITLSLVGGLALNSIEPDARRSRRALALDARNSLAWQSGVSVWFDMNSRTAFNVSAGYLITRPRTTFFEDGRLTARTLRADTSLVSVGLAYKLF